MEHRHPTKVSYINSFEQDSARRDLTINSMGINTKGEIIDYHGGLEDIKNGIIKTVGKSQERFTEDALRIIRAARFASRYGFKIDPDTKSAMKDLGHLIDNLSAERISGELIKIAKDGNQLANYIEHLDDVGLLERILPEVKALQGKLQNPAHHPEGDAYAHSIQALRHSRSNNPVTNISIIFHDLGKGTVTSGERDGHPTYNAHDKASGELVEVIGKRLKMPNSIIKPAKFAAENHMKGHRINVMKPAKVAKLVNDPNWPILKDVMYADEMSRGDIGKGGEEEFEAKIQQAEESTAKLSQGMGASGLKSRIKSLINGHKVIEWTGLKPGIEMGTILKQTQDWLHDNIDADQKTVKDYVISLYNDIKKTEPESLEECYRRIYEKQTRM
jgi:tRNA nucleotidyltransferase/poly(A) polymerase